MRDAQVTLVSRVGVPLTGLHLLTRKGVKAMRLLKSLLCAPSPNSHAFLIALCLLPSPTRRVHYHLLALPFSLALLSVSRISLSPSLIVLFTGGPSLSPECSLVRVVLRSLFLAIPFIDEPTALV